ncbi:MAG: bifunctional phosphopantothenoylcysteine decarboxylase/phosphopantothenate--cysteine ligase CoaBC [Deltaproteobacteria bacterium]|nr:bifunctional phosphopantothenoylcysteine decarboxylase/phosphopantothenate--cysteine ligase CoaBC [Deltaproteobacteria bacterium]
MYNSIQNKNIVLCVCGGIAAYKAVELLRLLVRHGAAVRVVMTENAVEFVGRLTFEAISGRPVCTTFFGRAADPSIKHIVWAEEADAVIVAPATANIIGKLANGIADDAISTFMLAVTSFKIICPAMNTHMYENRAVQRNLDILESDGFFIMEPESGDLACGTTGPGRLPDPESIIDRLNSLITSKDFSGRKVLVTAGPTREPVDPVRFISNPSSGRMGFAVAKAAEQRGAEVVLITGPVSLPDPPRITTLRVNTAMEMADVVFEYMDKSDIIIKTAAVSDYRPVDPAEHKIKKGKETITLSMQKTRDILKELGKNKKDRILVGFAAETENLEQYAQQKLREKNLDLIVGNIVGSSLSSGFQSETNKVTLFFKDGAKQSLPLMEKEDVANAILQSILDQNFASQVYSPPLFKPVK